MNRRNFIRLTGGGVVLAAGASLAGCSGSAYPADALEAWQGPSAAASEPRMRALSYAITAPNPHNLQPWLADLREANAITIYTDPERILPETDPFGRQILIGHGAFLELLVIALAEQGLSAQVKLWPEGELGTDIKAWRSAAKTKPIARLELRAGASRDPLFTQILQRRSHKGEFDLAQPVPQSVLNTLTEQGANVAIKISGSASGALPQALRKLTLDAGVIEISTPRTILESLRLMRVGPSEISQHRDGISANSAFIRFAAASGMLNRKEAPTLGSAGYKGAYARFEGHSRTAVGFVWMSAANTCSDQIAVGRAYVRMNLKATEMKLAMHPLSQALQEFAEMRPLYEAVHQQLLGKPAPQRASDETVQMLCRIGYAKEAAPTPRRELGKFIYKA